MTQTPFSVFDPYEFFAFASGIVRSKTAPEAALRSAISRAYYSIFLTARDKLFGCDQSNLTRSTKKRIEKDFLRKYGIRKKNLGSHEFIMFAVWEKTSNVALKQQLDQLRQDRVSADYKMDNDCLTRVNHPDWQKYAEDSMALASQLLTHVKSLTQY